MMNFLSDTRTILVGCVLLVLNRLYASGTAAVVDAAFLSSRNAVPGIPAATKRHGSRRPIHSTAAWTKTTTHDTNHHHPNNNNMRFTVATLNHGSIMTSQSPDENHDDAGDVNRTSRQQRGSSGTEERGRVKATKSARTPLKTWSQWMEDITAVPSGQEEELQSLVPILDALQEAFQSIATVIQRASIDGYTGYAPSTERGAVNVQGERQKKLDLMTNDILKRALRNCRSKDGTTAAVSTMISEEDQHEIRISVPTSARSNGTQKTKQYIVAFDPLDGSGNTDTNVPLGTIFAIYDATPTGRVQEDRADGDDLDRLMRRPLSRTVVGAGYCFYSSATSFVVSLGRVAGARAAADTPTTVGGGGGVQGFTFDPRVGEFVLSHPDIRIPERGTTYSVNEANRRAWTHPAGLRSYISDLQRGLGGTNQTYSLRYIGSMVGDIHRTMLGGGFFAYPADTKNRRGKLRLLYEVAPMSYLTEQAGGIAITTSPLPSAPSSTSSPSRQHHHRHLRHQRRVLDLVPSSIHERAPVMLGSAGDVSEFLQRCSEQCDPDDVVEEDHRTPVHADSRVAGANGDSGMIDEEYAEKERMFKATLEEMFRREQLEEDRAQSNGKKPQPRAAFGLHAYLKELEAWL